MLPNKDKRGKPVPLTVDTSGSDLMSEACRRCMARLINAIQSQDVNAAMDAFGDLMAVHEYSEEDEGEE